MNPISDALFSYHFYKSVLQEPNVTMKVQFVEVRPKFQVPSSAKKSKSGKFEKKEDSPWIPKQPSDEKEE